MEGNCFTAGVQHILNMGLKDYGVQRRTMLSIKGKGAAIASYIAYILIPRLAYTLSNASLIALMAPLVVKHVTLIRTTGGVPIGAPARGFAINVRAASASGQISSQPLHLSHAVLDRKSALSTLAERTRDRERAPHSRGRCGRHDLTHGDT